MWAFLLWDVGGDGQRDKFIKTILWQLLTVGATIIKN